MASVLFICVHNAGKSQTAAALMRHFAGDTVQVYSAGTGPNPALAADAVAALGEIDVSVGNEFPKPIDPEIIAKVDRVIVLGTEATVSPVEGMRGFIEVWPISEPKELGILGEARARLIRDEIKAKVLELAAELVAK
ncbi:MAG: hypothetical protein RL556_454 [Actinomycetota bacterium]|jgi:arsenate-mycothiol transferase